MFYRYPHNHQHQHNDHYDIVITEKIISEKIISEKIITEKMSRIAALCILSSAFALEHHQQPIEWVDDDDVDDNDGYGDCEG